MNLNEKELTQQLYAEGFTRVFVWTDGSGVHYAEHTHKSETVHIILTGQMTLEMDGQSEVYQPGDRVDVPPGQTHIATMGPEGCRYLVGER
jgi:mannose-6-phosphate isomerase-like protein (cupin superfamily)